MKSKGEFELKPADQHSILIVDDLAKNIQLVAKFLTDEGYNLFFAQSGEIALKQVNARPFDLILLDVMMPGMDGFEVCRKIKENEKTNNIPIIFLTAKTDDDAIVKGFTMGGVDYITKPFNPVELIARVRTHINLRQREKELRDLNNTKDTLLSVISHDLKTPFFNIMGLGDLLLKGYEEYDDALKKELISNMVESSRISHNLLENLLSWIRVQTGKIQCVPQPVNLLAIISEIFRLVETQIKNKDVACILEIDESIFVRADDNMFQTIIRNLLTNAIKYTPRGGIVKVISNVEDNRAIIEVIDTGIGMSAEKLETLFIPTNISSTPGTENESGTGFGLILVKQFVELNGGQIKVESRPGKGTTFQIILPVADNDKNNV
jgi:two-component system, sensor histidine kinase and response regulator